jgi:GDP-L-fucose synthase
VDDLGEACVFALEHWSPAPGELTYLNVGTGMDLSICELAEAVATPTGYQGPIECDSSKPDGSPKRQPDVRRMAALGWRVRIPLEEGLTNTVAFYRYALQEQAFAADVSFNPLCPQPAAQDLGPPQPAAADATGSAALSDAG